MKIKAVIFDLYGTLLEINNHRGSPYHRLHQLLVARGLDPAFDFKRCAMTQQLSIGELSSKLGFPLRDAEEQELESELISDVRAIRPYKDVTRTLEILTDQGMEVGMCSNLAPAYYTPVMLRLPSIRHKILSYEQGHIKPDPAMYDVVLHKTGMKPNEILFVGDHHRNDVSGPMCHGMHAVHLLRGSPTPHPSYITTLTDVAHIVYQIEAGNTSWRK